MGSAAGKGGAYMRKSKKGWTVCLLAAVMVLASLGGCQKAGSFPGENPAEVLHDVSTMKSEIGVL